MIRVRTNADRSDMLIVLLYTSAGFTYLAVLLEIVLGMQFKRAIERAGLDTEIRKYICGGLKWSTLLFLPRYADTETAKRLLLFRSANKSRIEWSVRVYAAARICFLTCFVLAMSAVHYKGYVIMMSSVILPVVLVLSYDACILFEARRKNGH